MPRKSSCELVRNGVIKSIPKGSLDKGMPNCLGYIDSYRDTEFDECKRCERFWCNYRRADDGRK